MQFKIWFSLAIAGLSTAATMDGPAVKGLLNSMNTAILNLDKSINAITTANVATQVEDINAKLTDLNKAISNSAARLKSSKPLGITDVFSLSTPLLNGGKSMTTLLNDLMAKRTIIVNSGQADKLGRGLKSIKKGLAALSEAMPSQIPANLMPKGGASLSPNKNQLAPGAGDKLMDVMFDIIIAIFKGGETKITIPAGILPLKGAKAPKKQNLF